MTASGRCILATAANLKLAMAQHRNEETAEAKAVANTRQRKLASAKADRLAALAVMREMERGYRDVIRFAIRIRVKPSANTGKERGAEKTIRITPAPRRAASRGSSWEIDEAGRRGVHYQQSYISRKSPSFKEGCARQRVLYITRSDAVLADERGEALIFSNLGLTIDEMGNAWDAVEAASTRKNAKIQIEAIVAFDADAAPDEQVAALRIFLQTVFEPLNIGYTAAIHVPSSDGDERNTHAHILFNLRPVRRIATNEWEIADTVVRELDGKTGVTALRNLWAHAQTLAAEEAKRDMTYTALSYANRGLDRQAGEHLGPARSAQLRRGDHVPAALRNRRKAVTNGLRRQLADLDSKKRALVRMKEAFEKRTSAFAKMKVPQRPPSSRLPSVELEHMGSAGNSISLISQPSTAALPDAPHSLGTRSRKPVAPSQPIRLELPLTEIADPAHQHWRSPANSWSEIAMRSDTFPPHTHALSRSRIPPSAASVLGARSAAMPMQPASLLGDRQSLSLYKPSNAVGPIAPDHRVNATSQLTTPIMPPRPHEVASVSSPPPTVLRVSTPGPLHVSSSVPELRAPACLTSRLVAAHRTVASAGLERCNFQAPNKASVATQLPAISRAIPLDDEWRRQLLKILQSMQQLFEFARKKEKQHAQRNKTADTARYTSVANPDAQSQTTEYRQAVAPRSGATQPPGQFADGFGGVQATPPPAHTAPAGALRMPAFESGGLPRRSLKNLLYCLARHPQVAEFADDGRLTIRPTSRNSPDVREAAFFMHCWRSDPSVHDLMVEVIRRARANDVHPWPARFADRLCEFAQRRDREEEEIKQRSIKPRQGPWIERGGISR